MLFELFLIVWITDKTSGTVFFSKFMYFYIFYSYLREWIISMDGTIREGIPPKYYRTIKCIFNIIKYTIVFVILLALIYYCMLFYCMLFGLYPVSLKDVLPAYSLCVISILLYDFLVTKVLRTMRFSNIFYIAFSDPMIVGEATEKSRATRQYGYARRYTSTDGLAWIEIYYALFVVLLDSLPADDQLQLAYAIILCLFTQVKLYFVIAVYWPEKCKISYYYIDKYFKIFW